MHRFTVLVALALAGSISLAARGAERCTQGDPQLVEVKSIKALPREVAVALDAERVGLFGIADYAQEFNRTDDVDSSLPMRRFAVAGVSQDCILIAIERGGRGYWIEVVMFERS